jgi:uncharacterized membrane protein YfcA
LPSGLDLAAAAVAASLAGGINAVAGGGTLVSFPVLVGLGVPSVQANVTNTIALCPGYFGGAYAQRSLLTEQRDRARKTLPIAALGGLLGSILLVVTPESVFDSVVPWLIITACLLLGLQDSIKAIVFRHRANEHQVVSPLLIIGTFLSAIYGGYFGAGLGIMLLAVLGLALDDKLPTLNALKTLMSTAINLIAALFLAFSGKADWAFVAVMAPASLVGGHLGGLVATRLNPKVLRVIVITFGTAVAIRMLIF